MNDQTFMQNALSIARQGVGRTGQNPSVGCVLIKNGQIIARARTADGGRPHAETQALGQAGHKATGATAYVTLEPCAHDGDTPSCANELIKAGVSKVVIAINDPDPRTNGNGIQKLRDAVVEVVTDICRDDAYEINRGFFYRFEKQRPFISLKIATSANGKIAKANGESKWITGELSRRRAHLIRARHDTIAVGAGTVLMDNPSLTTRLNGVDHLANIILFDRRGRLTGNEKVFENDPLVISDTDLKTAMKKLVDHGVTRLMVEGGSQLLSSFIREGLYDQFYWFRAPHDLPDDGIDAIADFDIKELENNTKLIHSDRMILGQDTLDIYKRND